MKRQLTKQKLFVKIGIRVKGRHKMLGEMARDVGITAKSKISSVMKSVIGCLQQKICTPFRRLSDFYLKFGFLLDVEN